MNTTFILGLCCGIGGALLLNVGKGVQKWKVHVLLTGRQMLRPPNRREFFIWLFGLLMTISAALPYSLGLHFSKSPSSIGAMTGVGLIGLVIFALVVIGERPGLADRVGIALVVVGTSSLGYFGAMRDLTERIINNVLLFSVALPLLIVAVAFCLSALRWRRLHGIAFGTTAGLCLGLGIFLGDIALMKGGEQFSAQLHTPYPYVAYSFCILAAAVTQLGFLRGRALEVVPAVNSATILTPLLLEIAIYHICPRPLELLLIGVIVVGVMLLSRGAAARVSD